MQIPTEYHGREQAYIKHTILRTYLTRLFMIIGNGETVINYIDCFAGPWQDESDELRSTSIGISIEEMEKCVKGIRKIHGRSVKFRALYIEKDPKAYQRLQAYVQKQHHSSITVERMEGDYREHISDVVTWCGPHFSFFFIDPKGWKNVIGGATLKPLLALKKAEFLINFMYDFMNRAASIDKHAGEDMEELVGEPLVLRQDLSPKQRQDLIISKYRENIKRYYQGGRTVYIPIERPGQDKVLYFLVYLTRHPLGIAVIKEEAEKGLVLQERVKFETRLQNQINKNNTMDLFAESNYEQENIETRMDDQGNATQFLLSVLSSKNPLLIDNECWADFLENTDLYPGDLQKAMKGLLQEGLVENLDADASRRRTRIIQPNWPNKSEKWRLV